MLAIFRHPAQWRLGQSMGLSVHRQAAVRHLQLLVAGSALSQHCEAAMESDDGFESFNRNNASDPLNVLFARWRCDAFMRKLKKLPDVVEVIASGSFARGTFIGPVHDIDLIVVFDRSAHPDYGIKDKSRAAVESAQAALTHMENELLEQLHPWSGTPGELLKETEQRKHVVTYGDNWVGPFKGVTLAPPVDVLPAVREGAHLVIPERGTGWIDTDPEAFMRQVEERKRQWKHFAQVSGMVKAWARHNHLKVKSLVIDAMVLEYAPRPGFFETLSCGEGVARFFETAFDPKKEQRGFKSLKALKELCKKIDPKLDVDKLRAELGKAAHLARSAMNAESKWEHRHSMVGEVTHPDVFWRELFGEKYPSPRKRYFRAAESEPWLGASPRKRRTTAGTRERNARGEAPFRPPGRGDHPKANRDQDHPDEPRSEPTEPGDGPRRPSGGPRRPSGGSPGSPHGPSRRPRRPPAEPRLAEPAEPTAAEPAVQETGATVWADVFGPSAAAASMPLTFG